MSILDQPTMGAALLIATVENKGGGAAMSESDRDTMIRIKQALPATDPLHGRAAALVQQWFAAQPGAGELEVAG
mgnify:CR=1 FL=1